MEITIYNAHLNKSSLQLSLLSYLGTSKINCKLKTKSDNQDA